MRGIKYMVKKKRSAIAIRTARSTQKYKSYGLTQITVWTEPDEADTVRRYAARNPKTKAIRRQMLKDDGKL